MSLLHDILPPEGGGIISLVGAGGKTTLMFRMAEELIKTGETVLTTTTTKIFIPSERQSPVLIIASNPDDVLKRASTCLKTGTRHITAAPNQLRSQNKLSGYPPRVIDAMMRSRIFSWIIVEADGAAQRPLKAHGVNEPVIPRGSACVVAVMGLDAVGKPLNDRWVYRADIYSDITGLPLDSIVTERSMAHIILDDRGLMKGCPDGAQKIVFLNKAEGAPRVTSGKKIGAILKKKGKRRLDRILIGSLKHMRIEIT